MNKFTTKIVAAAVAVTTVGTMLSGALGAPQKALAATRDITYKTSDTYYFNNNVRGYYTEPVEAGQYQTVILIHGNGSDCASWLAQQMPQAMEYWVEQGYLEPMEIVMPWVPHASANDTQGIDGHKNFAFNYTDDLAYKLPEITTKADMSKKIVISGYSMGGSDSLTAAALYPDLFQEVGALSSSHNFYHPLDPNYGDSFFHSKDDMHFNSNTRAYITYGAKEASQPNSMMGLNADTFYGILKNDFHLNAFEYRCENLNWGGHGNALFLREIFMYFYYLQHDGAILSEAEVEQACGPIYKKNYTSLTGPKSTQDHHPSTDPVTPNQALTVSAATSTKTKVTHGESYTVSVNVQGGTGNYTYDWQYSTSKDSGYTSTILKDANGNSKNGKSSLVIDKASRDIYYRCKVSDGNTTFYSDPVFISVAAKINSISSTGYGVTLKPNATYTITVEAEGLELSYMWEYSCDGGVTWYKSTNTGYNTKTATYINREENHVQVIYYRCTVTSAGTSTTATIKLGK